LTGADTAPLGVSPSDEDTKKYLKEMARRKTEQDKTWDQPSNWVDE